MRISTRVETQGAHDHVTVWIDGENAGRLVVGAGAGVDLARLLDNQHDDRSGPAIAQRTLLSPLERFRHLVEVQHLCESAGWPYPDGLTEARSIIEADLRAAWGLEDSTANRPPTLADLLPRRAASKNAAGPSGEPGGDA